MPRTRIRFAGMKAPDDLSAAIPSCTISSGCWVAFSGGGHQGRRPKEAPIARHDAAWQSLGTAGCVWCPHIPPHIPPMVSHSRPEAEPARRARCPAAPVLRRSAVLLARHLRAYRDRATLAILGGVGEETPLATPTARQRAADVAHIHQRSRTERRERQRRTGGVIRSVIQAHGSRVVVRERHVHRLGRTQRNGAGAAT